MPLSDLQPLPPKTELETPSVMRALVQAHRYLAELKGVAKTIPNEGILLSSLSLQEAQSSSAIENIITTQDALFKHELQAGVIDPATKEVAHYAEALRLGYALIKQQSSLTLNTILDIQACLERNNAGLRKVSGTVLRNEQTGKVVFEPPAPNLVQGYMSALELFINNERTIDPLICMALIHYQFETIHPFYDGNGRTGRIVNILYLVLSGLLDVPVLYLSRYINQTRPEYYKGLQRVRENNDWESWLVYMLKGVSLTAQHTTSLIEGVRQLLLAQKAVIRQRYKFYSQDLINNLFHHPYTKVAFLERDLKISRATAARYLNALAEDELGVLVKHKEGRENYYVNFGLVDLLFNSPELVID